MGLLGTLGKNVLGIAREAPISSALNVALMAEPVVGGATDFVSGLDLFGGQAQKMTEARRKEEDLQDMIRARDQRMRKLRMVNLQRVAATNPDVYNQVAAGRRLPRGAVMIGGRPRTDLLAELADALARGGPVSG